jgi:four helix bundle protein
MSNDNLKVRTKQLAVAIIKLIEALPAGKTCEVVGRQLLRSGTSVAANYRAACRAKSPADFIFKMGIVEEEADESCFWIELLIDAGKLDSTHAAPLLKEANELVAITVASIRTAKKTRDLNSSANLNSPARAPKTPHSAFRVQH